MMLDEPRSDSAEYVGPNYPELAADCLFKDLEAAHIYSRNVQAERWDGFALFCHHYLQPGFTHATGEAVGTPATRDGSRRYVN